MLELPPPVLLAWFASQPSQPADWGMAWDDHVASWADLDSADAERLLAPHLRTVSVSPRRREPLGAWLGALAEDLPRAARRAVARTLAAKGNAALVATPIDGWRKAEARRAFRVALRPELASALAAAREGVAAGAWRALPDLDADGARRAWVHLGVLLHFGVVAERWAPVADAAAVDERLRASTGPVTVYREAPREPHVRRYLLCGPHRQAVRALSRWAHPHWAAVAEDHDHRGVHRAPPLRELASGGWARIAGPDPWAGGEPGDPMPFVEL